MNISRQVDLIIIAKGNGIPIHTFQMASMNCRLYFWMPDTFTHFKNNSLLESTKFCAYRSATGYGTSLLWSDKLKLPVYHVIDGTDPELYFPENREKIYDIIFIGAADPERTIIYDYLKKNNYIGILILDDIYLNEPMRYFWNEVCKNEDKMDISHLGHWSGTGIIYFNM